MYQLLVTTVLGLGKTAQTTILRFESREMADEAYRNITVIQTKWVDYTVAKLY